MTKPQILEWIKGLSPEDKDKYLAFSIGDVVYNAEIVSKNELLGYLEQQARVSLDGLSDEPEDDDGNDNS